MINRKHNSSNLYCPRTQKSKSNIHSDFSSKQEDEGKYICTQQEANKCMYVIYMASLINVIKLSFLNAAKDLDKSDYDR